MTALALRMFNWVGAGEHRQAKPSDVIDGGAKAAFRCAMKALSNEALTFLLAALIEDLDARDRCAGRKGVTSELAQMVASFRVQGERIRPPLKIDHGATAAAELLRWLQEHQHPETAQPSMRG